VVKLLLGKSLCHEDMGSGEITVVHVLCFTDVRGPLHEKHLAEICFNLMMSKPNPLAISWTGVVIGIWWITVFVGLSDCK